MRIGDARTAEDARGFTLLFVLLLVVLLGLLTSLAARSYTQASRRVKEEELLFRGMQYRDAIGRYHRFQGRLQYPTTLDALLKDPRSAATVRHLRTLYTDPMTDNAFVPIKTPEGWIVGVRSGSGASPLRQAEFPPGLETFAGRRAYREWEFVYRPPTPLTAPTAVPPGRRGLFR
ncbi:MAG: type II secretion system protein [Desulfobacteria bacterium]|nr:type II secretion system protein [Deltaproteobacteria bacterium]HQT98584.1 type II secretion system protein [Thermodesulfobacteriota bacterium]